MEISVVFQSISLIALMILIGALISRTFSFNDDTRGLFITLIVNIAMPSIILSSIFKVEIDDAIFEMIAIVFGLSILINLGGIALGWILASSIYRQSTKKREIAILSGLGNTGFIGIPLCAALFGPKGALFAAIFDAGVDFTIWTVGVLMLQKKQKFSFRTLKAMVNIPTVAIVIGLSIAYFQVKPPSLVIQLTDQLAALAAPLAMFYIGVLVMTLQQSKLKKSGQKVWLPITVKLILLPILATAMIYFIRLDQVLIQTVLIQSMMPTLTLASILFAKYSADEDMGALTTVISTVVALISIPLMILMMNFYFL